MLAMAGRTRMVPHDVRLMKRMSHVAALTILIQGSHRGRAGRRQRAELKWTRNRFQRRRQKSARPGLGVAMARRANIAPRAGQPGKSFGGMLRGQFAGRDKSGAKRAAQTHQQNAGGEGNDRNGEEFAPGMKTPRGNAFQNRTAAGAVGPRPGSTRAAVIRRARATVTAFVFAFLDFQRRPAFVSCAASTFGVGSDAARFSLRRFAADPVLVRALVLARIEFRRGQLLFHRAPPEKAKTRTMCASVKSNRL